mgnify:CR=1 FL=1
MPLELPYVDLDIKFETRFPLETGYPLTTSEIWMQKTKQKKVECVLNIASYDAYYICDHQYTKSHFDKLKTR